MKIKEWCIFIIELGMIAMVCYAMYLFNQPRRMECEYGTDKT